MRQMGLLIVLFVLSLMLLPLAIFIVFRIDAQQIRRHEAVQADVAPLLCCYCNERFWKLRALENHECLALAPFFSRIRWRLRSLMPS